MCDMSDQIGRNDQTTRTRATETLIKANRKATSGSIHCSSSSRHGNGCSSTEARSSRSPAPYVPLSHLYLPLVKHLSPRQRRWPWSCRSKRPGERTPPSEIRDWLLTEEDDLIRYPRHPNPHDASTWVRGLGLLPSRRRRTPTGTFSLLAPTLPHAVPITTTLPHARPSPLLPLSRRARSPISALCGRASCASILASRVCEGLASAAVPQPHTLSGG
jgi:hypothetical protein